MDVVSRVEEALQQIFRFHRRDRVLKGSIRIVLIIPTQQSITRAATSSMKGATKGKGNTVDFLPGI